MELAGLEPATSWVRSRRALALTSAICRVFAAVEARPEARIFGQFPPISAGIGPKKPVFGPISPWFPVVPASSELRLARWAGAHALESGGMRHQLWDRCRRSRGPGRMARLAMRGDPLAREPARRGGAALGDDGVSRSRGRHQLRGAGDLGGRRFGDAWRRRPGGHGTRRQRRLPRGGPAR